VAYTGGWSANLTKKSQKVSTNKSICNDRRQQHAMLLTAKVNWWLIHKYENVVGKGIWVLLEVSKVSSN
jgi:hypothetical protein